MGTGLTQIQMDLLAALAEQVYNRNANDDPITLNELGVAPAAIGAVSGLFFSGTSYYSPRGFVGEVVTDGTTDYVVLRGTDLSASFLDGFEAALPDLDQIARPDAKGQIDIGDVVNDALLGWAPRSKLNSTMRSPSRRPLPGREHGLGPRFSVTLSGHRLRRPVGPPDGDSTHLSGGRELPRYIARRS
jgi:hypothetical protein